jgi:hypothetical protein
VAFVARLVLAFIQDLVQKRVLAVFEKKGSSSNKI